MSTLDRLKRLFGLAREARQAEAPMATPAPAGSDVSEAPSTVPAADGAPAAVAAPAAAAPPAVAERRGKARVNARPGTRVLIIDDSATIVALLGRMLRQNGYITLEAEDAEKGLVLAASESPELIFLDIVLPGMNGFAALRQLRRDAATKHVPIIMISGNEQATEAFYVQRIGADDFMKKPFSRAEVFMRIERLLDANLVPRRAGMQGRGDEESETESQST